MYNEIQKIFYVGNHSNKNEIERLNVKNDFFLGRLDFIVTFYHYPFPESAAISTCRKL